MNNFLHQVIWSERPYSWVESLSACSEESRSEGKALPFSLVPSSLTANLSILWLPPLLLLPLLLPSIGSCLSLISKPSFVNLPVCKEEQWLLRNHSDLWTPVGSMDDFNVRFHGLSSYQVPSHTQFVQIAISGLSK